MVCLVIIRDTSSPCEFIAYETYEYQCTIETLQGETIDWQARLKISETS
jgi:hypothetical protein